MEIIVRKTFAMAVILRVAGRIIGVVYAVTYVTIVSVQVTSTWLQQLTAYANYLLVRYSYIDESLRNERIVRCSSQDCARCTVSKCRFAINKLPRGSFTSFQSALSPRRVRTLMYRARFCSGEVQSALIALPDRKFVYFTIRDLLGHSNIIIATINWER